MTGGLPSCIIVAMMYETFFNFDLRQIAASGQCFRMRETTPGVYTIVSRGRLLTVSQEGPKVAFDCPEVDLSYWKEYFDCATDYGRIQSMVSPKHPYLTAAAKAGQGIRILRQEPWEMIITFVISQQKTIPKIREAVEALSRAYGTRLETALETKPLAAVSPRTAAQGLEGEGFYAFPTPEQLNRASLEELSALKLGYRAKYIKKLCADAAEGRLDLNLLETLDYSAAMDYLTGFYGIGRKVANCICLFGLHHIEAFPVDTWIEKILKNEYYPKHPRKYAALPKAQLYPAIIRDFFGRYRGCAGVMQQYIFYYERLRQNRAEV